MLASEKIFSFQRPGRISDFRGSAVSFTRPPAKQKVLDFLGIFIIILREILFVQEPFEIPGYLCP
jgi:hypothetical protein